MKTATITFKNILAANKQFVTVDIYDIVLTDGTQFHVTSSDSSFTYNGVFYSSTSLQLSGLVYKLSIGLDVDEQTIDITASRDMLVNAIPVMDSIRNGAFDLARITRSRLYALDWSSPFVGEVLLFTGYVSTIDSIGRLTAQMKVKSDLAILDVSMPKRLYQAGCMNVLYDNQCKVNKNLYLYAGSTEAASTKTLLNWASATVDFFDLGAVSFTSGLNLNETRTIKKSTGGSLVLSYPLSYVPEIGDTFNAIAGCDKVKATCINKFNNLENMMAFPFVPAAEKAF